MTRDAGSVVRSLLAGDRSPLATLVRLFVLGDAVSPADLAAAVPLPEAAPLVVDDGGDVRAAFDVTPHGQPGHDWWVVSDRVDALGRPSRTDHVVGIGAAATTLAQITVRPTVDRALDIGTGNGVQALHLSVHSATVTATDVVPHALQLAATSFALSGVDVRLRGGDLDGPVADEEFDLVVCNPPFVVGPTAEFAYRDGRATSADVDGDDMSRRAVEAAARVLAPGGVAQLLANWLHVRDEDWRDRVAGWVSALGCDAWLIERDAVDPVDYVGTWLADSGGSADPDAAGRWLEWFRRRRVDGVGVGWVVLRRTDGPMRIAVEELRQPVEQPLGAEILGWLERTQWLRSRTDGDLFAAAFRASGSVRLVQSHRAASEGWQGEAQHLAVDGGFRWSLPCDDVAATLVAACDGSRPLAAIAAVLGLTTGLTEEDLAAALPGLVRGLVDRGVLLPPA